MARSLRRIMIVALLVSLVGAGSLFAQDVSSNAVLDCPRSQG